MVYRKFCNTTCLASVNIMNAVLVTIIAILMLAISRNSISNIENGLSGNFSFYFLNQQWIQEFCEVKPKACNSSLDIEEKPFTFHGLWPQYNQRKYPSYCSHSPGCKTEKPCDLDWESLTDQVKKFLMENIPINTIWLANHEWKKHGTCSGLTQKEYFEIAEKIFTMIETKKVILDSVGTYISYAEIQKQYNNSVMIQCYNDAGKNYLYSLTSYWRKDSAQLYFDYREEDLSLNNCSSITQIYIRGLPQAHSNNQKIKWVVSVITTGATVVTFGIIGTIIGYTIYKSRSNRYENL